MDIGHKEADIQLRRLTKKLKEEYDEAYAEMTNKINTWFEKFEAKDEAMLKKVTEGTVKYTEYIRWRTNKMISRDQMQSICNELSEILVNHNITSTAMINDMARSVWAANYNYGAYEICDGLNMNIAFSLVDERTLDVLADPDFPMRPPRKNIPQTELDLKKDYTWNMQKVRSAITQGIVQGDSISKISQRLRQVTNMDNNAAVRNARTMTTAAENAGRMESYKAAEKLGVKMKKRWLAAMDARTRDAHVLLDGKSVDVDKPFKSILGDIMFPADPNCKVGANVWNCRCTLVADVKGHSRDFSDRKNPAFGNISYSQWKDTIQKRARKKA